MLVRKIVGRQRFRQLRASLIPVPRRRFLPIFGVGFNKPRFVKLEMLVNNISAH
jgi:hypothetical protein